MYQGIQEPLTLVPAGYIAAGDAEGGGYLSLGQGNGAAQPVAKADDLRLPGSKALGHQSVQLPGAVPVVEIVQHGIIHSHDVQ